MRLYIELRKTSGSLKRGMTFIELCLATGLLSIISLVLYSSFNMGVKAYQQGAGDAPEVSISIFFDKLAFDLRNYFNFSFTPPRGLSDELSFAVFNPAYDDDDEYAGFGRLKYSFNLEEKNVLRQYQDFAIGRDKELKRDPGVILKNIGSCSFKYYYFDNALKRWDWKNNIQETLPSAIQVSVTYFVKDRECSLSRIIPVPLNSGVF